MLLVVMFKKWYRAEDQTEGIIDSVTMHVHLLQGILFFGHATVIPSDFDKLSEWQV